MSGFKYDANASRELIRDIDNYVRQLYEITKILWHMNSGNLYWDDTQRKRFSNGVEMLKNDIKSAMEAEVAYLNFYKEIINEFEGK